MANFIQNMVGLGDMTEQVIATDLMLASKIAIKSYAAALAEVATPEVRDVLHRHLDVAIGAHERITNYMMEKGYYRAYEPQEQIRVDMEAADTVISLNRQS